MPTIAETAEAVKSLLNASAFSVPFTAVRGYRPTYTLEDLATIRVTVIPRAVAIADRDRGHNRYEHQIDVAIQKKLDEETNGELDPLVALVAEIIAALTGPRLATLPEGYVTDLKNEPVFAPEHLDQQRVFTSLVTVGIATSD